MMDMGYPDVKKFRYMICVNMIIYIDRVILVCAPICVYVFSISTNIQILSWSVPTFVCVHCNTSVHM